MVVGVEVMFGGRGPGRVVELRAGADRSVGIGLVVSKYSAVLPHRDGGAPEIEVGVVRVVGPVVRGIRLRRRQGERHREENEQRRQAARTGAPARHTIPTL